jgi:hypothetical protein
MGRPQHSLGSLLTLTAPTPRPASRFALCSLLHFGTGTVSAPPGQSVYAIHTHGPGEIRSHVPAPGLCSRSAPLRCGLSVSSATRCLARRIAGRHSIPMGAPTMPMLVRNLQDRLLELRQLRDEALARRDAVQAEELQAEIEELTAYLEEIFEVAAGA